jgi:hypothetical protein
MNTLNLKTINSLVTLSVSSGQPGWTFKDNKATARLREANGGGTARVNDTIWTREGYLADASRAITSATTAVRAFGLPQPKGGTYYIQRRDIPAIQQIADEAAAKLAVAKAGIVRDFPEILAANQARVAIGGASVRWPSSGLALADKFSLEIRWTSAPAVLEGAALEGLTAEVAARVRAASAAQVEADFKAAHGAPLEDLFEQLAGAVEQLSKGKRLRTERFAGLKDAAERLQRLNWLELPSLTAVSAAVAGAVEVAAVDAASLAETERAALKKSLDDAKFAAADALAGLGL